MTSSIKNHPHHVDAWGTTLCFMLVIAATLMPDYALAATLPDATGGLNTTICKIVAVLQGNVARGVAACGIIFLGFSLFMGKISWGTALSLGIGLGAIFGAKQVVQLMDPNNTAACNDLTEASLNVFITRI